MTTTPVTGRARAVVVVGAGIGGLAAAVLAARAGHEVELFESRAKPGGLLAPVHFGGLPCDRGSHRVHPLAHPLLRELTGDAGWILKQRCGRLVMGGRQVPYPPTPFRFLQGLGLKTSADMALGWLRRPDAFRRTLRWEHARMNGPQDVGFEAFVRGRVGGPAYERFYRPYAVKVWGGDPSELSQSVAKQRVSTSNPLPTLLGLTRHEFLYPADGMCALIESMLKKAKKLGVRFRFSTRYQLAQDDPRPVLFSGHLSDLAPTRGLTHKGLYLIYLEIPTDAVNHVDTWYSPETEFWFGRVSQPARFSGRFSGGKTTVLCVEVPEGDWGQDVNFVDRLPELLSQLRRAEIIQRPIDAVQSKQLFLPRVYPMYSKGWTSRWREAMEDVVDLGQVFPFGRQGLFLHCNMDHCVQMASDLVAHITAGGQVAEWSQRCRDYLSVRVRD